ncbi:hypothetical protein EUTSA_v10006372mg [Eutrema salsugineum]|uniref:Uncharacterized protein n=1 Tax=Eutrema salsugineum TaxID=72664 RepID=V4NDG5_EUTSA|nr:hypothetical protein EUTSA_v10006372mg [Eutrema salsugineum]
MDGMLDLETGMIHELEKPPVPGMWRFPTNPNLCCIYRVPECLREVNPKAYTPQLVLIGPLHRSLRSQALKSRGDITKTKSMGYLNTEAHKKIYLAEFAKRVEGKKRVVEGFRRMIEEDEDMIRASYSESTAWIESQEFVDMVLYDSVFIIELMLRDSSRLQEKIGDPLMDEPCLESTIRGDLILLENQLPYFILEKLFDPIVKILLPNQTLRTLVISYFELDKSKKMKEETSTFRHFTDLLRCVRVETLPEHGVEDCGPIAKMHNADKLDSRGLRFEAVEQEFSVEVKFDIKTGSLKIPCFSADDDMETLLRNIMAFEQSHYPYNAYVCDYITFLDLLIDTEKDVDLLVEKDVIDYYSDRCNTSRSILRRVYFSNVWRGTATVTAASILLLTLIQTKIQEPVAATKDNRSDALSRSPIYRRASPWIVSAINWINLSDICQNKEKEINDLTDFMNTNRVDPRGAEKCDGGGGYRADEE